jgi:hypothetical protein
MGCHKTSSRLSVCALAIASGFTWGSGVVLLGLIAMQYELGKPFVALLGSIYIGFEATVKGSFIGAGWAFMDGLIAGLIFALVYNFVLCVCGACCRKMFGDKKGG